MMDELDPTQDPMITENEDGSADAGGGLMTWVAFNPEYMFIDDIPENV
jgi:hypothetical protein